jgi:hypothetical protein
MRLLKPAAALRTSFAFFLAACFVVSTLPHRTQAAGGSKQLQRVRGTVGYATDRTATDFKAVFAKFDLPDDDYAVTRGGSAAVLALPDSSLVSLGENTSVLVSAFDSVSASPGATITVNGGSMRFDIKRPEGGAANYHFVTPTSQVAVRGTIGLIAFVNGITTVGCVACAADSVAVSVGTQTFTLVTGQFLTVSALGAVTTGALSSVVGTFSTAGVPVTAQAGAAAAGIPAAGAAAGAIIPAAAAAAAVGAAAVGISATSHTPSPQSTPSPQTTPSPQSTPSPHPTSTPTPTPPSASATGSVGLTGHAPPRAAPAAVPKPPVAAPISTPAPPRPPGPPGANGPNPRFLR